MHEPFSELALLLLIAAAVGALAVRLRQPVLIAYIVVASPWARQGWNWSVPTISRLISWPKSAWPCFCFW